jgi:hypothetical protein
MDDPRRRLGLPLALLAALSLSCGGAAPTTPTPTPDSFLTLHLTPSEGDLAWVPGANGWSVTLTPELRWKAEFVAPKTSWTLLVTVRLLNPAGVACLSSYTSLDTLASRSLPYTAEGAAYALPGWPENPCGDSFAISTVEVAVRDGSTDGAPLTSASVPCSFRFTRTVTP